MNWLLLKNSLLVGTGAALLAVVLGFLAALFVSGLSSRWQKACLGLGIVALALPPFLVTNCWLFFLGQTGVWRSWLAWNIMSLPGAILLLALMLWPISFLLVFGALSRLEPQLLESDPAVRGWNLFRALLFPLSGRALLYGVVLTFVLALNNFAIPAILQVKVYPAEIWIQYSTNLNAGAAFALSWPVVLAPLLLLIWFGSRHVPWPYVRSSASPALFRSQLGRFWFILSAAVFGLTVFLSAGLPVLQLIISDRTWSELPAAVAAGQSAIWGSLSLAFVTATSLMGAALLLTVWKLRARPNRFLVKGLDSWLIVSMWVPFFIPGVLLGIALILLLNHAWLTAFYTSAAIVVVALGLRYFGPGAGLLSHAVRRVDPNLVDVALLEGANRWQILRHVAWPQVASQVAAAWYVIFLLCIWDVESIILVVPPGVETLALRIFNLLHYGHNSQVDALCVTLLAAALLPLGLWTAGSHLARLAQSRTLRIGGLLGLLSALAVTGCSPSKPGSTAQWRSSIFDRVSTIGARGAGVGQLNKPRSVAVDRQDNLYVVDMTGRVQKFSSNGVFQLSWQMPQTDLGKPKGMCRDTAGNVIVLEPHYARVNHFSTEGRLACQWGVHGTNNSELSVPRAIGVNQRDEIFVTEYQQAERVQKFIWDHTQPEQPPRWQLSFGKAGSAPGEFNRPEGLCVDVEGSVHVADSCNHRIQVFDAQGKLIRMYGKPGKAPGEMSYPYDICVDPQGREYVCEFGNSRIQVFDRAGRSLEIIGGPGSDPGRFANPWGVALDSNGNLYVADSQNHRVQKLVRSRKDIEAAAATSSSLHVAGSNPGPTS